MRLSLGHLAGLALFALGMMALLLTYGARTPALAAVAPLGALVALCGAVVLAVAPEAR